MNKDSLFYKTGRTVYHVIRNIFYPYGYLRNYVWFPLSGFLRVHHVGVFYRKYAYIDEIRNRHLGERCFIIATGPSLRIEDIEKLENELTIGLNTIYKVYEKTNFRPNYYMALDPDIYQLMDESEREAVIEYARDGVFLNSIIQKKMNGIMYLPSCYQDHWFNYGNSKYNYAKNLKYSKDLLWGIYDKYTVTIAAIETAIHMGCKEIYLLGADCNYSGTRRHSDVLGDDKVEMSLEQAVLSQKAMMAGYRFMEMETKKRGIHVYNATRGGSLEEFDRIDFDAIFE